MKNELKNSNDIIVLKKDTMVSVLVISILVISVIFMGVLFVRNFQYNKALNNNESLLNSTKVSYSDTYLNIIVNYPINWMLAEIDLTETASTVLESSDDTNFNINSHKLTKEVISCMLVSNQTETGGFGQFMSLSFKGDNSLRGAELEKSLIEALKKEILATESENILITKNEVLNDTTILIEAECILNGTPIYYTQYTSLVGKNFGTALLGTKTKDIESSNNVSSLIQNILINNVMGESIINENTAVQETQNEINTNGFQIGR